MFEFSDWKENTNLIPQQIQNKEKYYHDLTNIEQSWTGRIDVMLANTFIQEAAQLIVNAIALFEHGYFDCAFYSLRQSLEVSTTMVYLAELSPEQRDIELEDWKGQSKFPMSNQMLKFLNDNGQAFSDIKKKMADYFDQLKQVKERLNKQVHKQGFNTFYVSRSHVLNRQRDQTQFVGLFESYVRSCIGAIAVLRLAIDPIPILLMDTDIYSRTDDLLTEAFSEEFVNEYIGEAEINAYKQTEVYIQYYEFIMNEEAKLPCVTDVVKHQYIDKEKYDDILRQAHLLSRTDLLAVRICVSSDKIAKVYFHDGWLWYFTNTRSVRVQLGFDSRALKEIRDSNRHINVPYDRAFLTYIGSDENIYIEHNEPFTESELSSILADIIADLHK